MAAIIRLPRKHGGLGLKSHSSTAPATYLASLATALPSIQPLLQGSSTQARRDYERHLDTTLDSVKADLGESAIKILPNSAADAWKFFGQAKQATKLQAKITSALAKNEYQALIKDRGTTDADRAHLLSASHPAAKTWLTTFPEENSMRLTNAEFQAAIRHRLNLPPDMEYLAMGCKCQSDDDGDHDGINTVGEPQHAHVCRANRKNSIYDRHQGIVGTLVDIARLAGATTRTEHHYLKRPKNFTDDTWNTARKGNYRTRLGPDHNVVPDVYVFTPSTRYMIDVAISYPGASTYINTLHSDQIPLACTKQRETVKHKKYDELARVNNYKFVAFAMESTGAIGKEADCFINEISMLTNNPRDFYIYSMRRLGIALQKGNALIQAEGLSHKRTLLEHAERASILEPPSPKPNRNGRTLSISIANNTYHTV